MDIDVDPNMTKLDNTEDMQIDPETATNPQTESPPTQPRKSVSINTDLNKVAQITPQKTSETNPTSQDDKSGSDAPPSKTLKSSLKPTPANPYVRHKADLELKKRQFCRRYMLKFKVPKDSKRQCKDHILQFILLLFTRAKQLDPATCLLPW